MSGFCSLLFRFLSVRCEAVVISQGSVFIFWSVEPFTTRPVFGFYLPVSSFFLVWFVRRRRVFSFSLSQALGNPKPFWFGVSLVFLQPGHALRPRSVRLPLHLHPGIALHLFFFFSSSSLVPGSVFARPGSVGVGFLGGCFFLSLVSVFLCALHCKTDLGTFKWGRETRHLPPL